jgi:hypothetical protein
LKVVSVTCLILELMKCPAGEGDEITQWLLSLIPSILFVIA